MTNCGGNYSDSYQHNIPTENPIEVDIVKQLFPRAIDSRGSFDSEFNQHLEWTKISQYNNTFIHYQYHIIIFEGMEYYVHQQQYYNHNYSDYRSPGFTILSIIKNYRSDNEIKLGVYMVNTKEYIEDLKFLEVMERVN